MEEYIAEKVEECLASIEKKLLNNGQEMSEREKASFRIGYQYGVLMAGMALVEKSPNLTI